MEIQSNILDLIISLTLIYALLSILVSIITEWWNHYRKARGKLLKQSIVKLLDDPLNLNYGDLFYNHYLISGLQKDSRPPQYISAGMFAEALIDVIGNQVMHCTPVTQLSPGGPNGKQFQVSPGAAPPPAKVIDRFEAALKVMKPSPFTDSMQSFYDKSDKDYAKLKTLIETWYNDYMDRVSGWYKNRQKWKFLVFGLFIALGLNVDSLHLVKVLSLDERLRGNLVATAERVADEYQQTADSLRSDYPTLTNIMKKAISDSCRGDSCRFRYFEAMRMLKGTDSLSKVYLNRSDSVLGLVSSLDLPLGWSSQTAPFSWFSRPPDCSPPVGAGLEAYNAHRNSCPGFWNILRYIAGILITAVSLSFGAPFWFDMLMKLVNIRRAGKKPPKQPDTK